MMANWASWNDRPSKFTSPSSSLASPLATFAVTEDFLSGGSDELGALLFAGREGVADVRVFASCPLEGPLDRRSLGLGIGVGKLA